MANPSARASNRTPTTIDLANPEKPPTETIQAPPPPPPDDVPKPLDVISHAHDATLALATEGKGSDVVEVYNRHASAIAGVGPQSKGRVRRAMLSKFPWALRAV